MKKIFYFIVIALCVLPSAVFAFSSPGKATGYINDFTSTLSASEKASLEAQAKNIATQSGAEIAVVIVPSFSGEDGKSYAVDLFKEWGIGKKGLDNGVLLLIGLEEREIQIEVGYGLEGAITDLQAKQIIEKVLVPAFRGGTFAVGIGDALKLLGDLAIGEAVDLGTPVQKSVSGKSFQIGFFALVFIVQILAGIMAKTKSWWLGGVFGAIGGVITGFVFGSITGGVIAGIILIALGLLLDYAVSKKGPGKGGPPFIFFGGRGGGSGGFGGGGGFGGFGGGGSGGGGAGGRW